MPEFSLSQSPRTQGFEQPVGPEDEEELFSKSFSDAAYRAFTKLHPELYGANLTFRILSVDAPAGEAVGAFVLRQGQEVLFVPAVMADNSIKPLDMFYARTKDRFLPLTPEWVQEVMASSVNPLGASVTPPDDLNTDVDIRNAIVPPTTGRYSYASAQDPAWDMVRAAYANEKRAADASPRVLTEVLGRMRPLEKRAMTAMLGRRPRLFKKMAELYGVKDLMASLEVAEAKTAHDNQREVPMKHDVYLAVAGVPVQELRRELKPGDVALAYKALRCHGFYLKDRRESVPNELLTGPTEHLGLMEPRAPGVYRVFFMDGKSEQALVIPQPISMYPQHEAPFFGGLGSTSGSVKQRFLVLLDDGRCEVVDELLGEPVVEVSQDELAERVRKMTKARPANDERGVLLSASGMTLRGTEPFSARNVSEGPGGVTFQANGPLASATVLLSERMHSPAFVRPTGQGHVVLSTDWRWLKLKDEYTSLGLVGRQDMIGRALDSAVEKTGAELIRLRKGPEGLLVGDHAEPMDHLHAIVKVANEYGLGLPDAITLVEGVVANLPVRAWTRPKTAADAPPADAPMDPAMAAPAPPPQPSGMDLALAEKLQTIQAQRAALDQMEQMLTEIQGRSQGIDQGGGMAAAPGAAAGMLAGPNPGAAGMPALAPVPGMGGGDPNAQQQQQQGGDPSMMQQGGDPSMMQQGGMDPNAQAQGGMDPSMLSQSGMPMEPPPQPVMPERPNPALFEQQVNPAFLEEAAQLHQEGVFDAAAVASLANVRSVRDLLQNYTPTLDNALDRLGRSLLLLYVKNREIRERIGEEAYDRLERLIRDLFRLMGDALLAINQYGEQLAPGRARPA